MPSKIKRITVANLKALSSLDISFHGATCIISAGNNKGKTSFIRSLMDRMKSIKPERILKQGERDGYYRMELTTGEKFEWKFDEKKEKLIFVSEKDIKEPLTKEISQYYFPALFDVDRFLEEAPKKQKAMLEKIAGIDFTDIDKEIAGAIEERKWANKKKEEAQVLVDQEKEIPDYKMSKVEDESYKVLETELNNAALHNERIKGVVVKLDFKKQALKANYEKIEALKAEIEKLTEANMLLETDIDKGDNWLKEDKNLPKDEDHTMTLAGRVFKIKQDNKKVVENNRIIVLYETKSKRIVEWEDADRKVKDLEFKKQDSIKNAHNLPEGFGFSDDGITYNGFAFDRQSLSASAIYIGALKLAAIGLGEVRTLYFDASLLDRKSLEEIEKWAQSIDCQLLIERPSWEGGEIEYQLLEDVK